MLNLFDLKNELEVLSFNNEIFNDSFIETNINLIDIKSNNNLYRYISIILLNSSYKNLKKLKKEAENEIIETCHHFNDIFRVIDFTEYQMVYNYVKTNNKKYFNKSYKSPLLHELKKFNNLTYDEFINLAKTLEKYCLNDINDVVVKTYEKLKYNSDFYYKNPDYYNKVLNKLI